MLLDLAQQMSITIDPDELIVGNRSLLPRMGVIAPEGAVEWVDRELESCRPGRRTASTSARKKSASCATKSFPTGAARRWKTWSPPACPQTSPRQRGAAPSASTRPTTPRATSCPTSRRGCGWASAGCAGRWRGRGRGGKLGGDRQVFYDAALIALRRGFHAHLPLCGVGRDAGAAAAPRGAPSCSKSRRCCRLAGRTPRARLPRGAAGRLVPVCAAPDRVQRQQLLAGPAGPVPAALPGRRSGVGPADVWPRRRRGWNCSGSSSTRSSCCAAAPARATSPASRSASTSSWAGSCPTAATPPTCSAIMCLRAQADLGLTQPNLSIRIHRDSPQDFLRAAAFVIGRGSGMPQVFNDEVIIPGQLRRGIAPAGCAQLRRGRLRRALDARQGARAGATRPCST